MTHLFADGGRIIKSTRREYADRLGDQGLAALVRAMMREQHKAMFIELRSGAYDDAITEICGAFADPLAADTTPPPGDVASRTRASEAPVRRSAPPLPPPRRAAEATAHFDVPATIPPPPRRPTMPGLRAVSARSGAGSAADAADAADATARAPENALQPPSGPRYAATRPAPIFSDAVIDGVSVFGRGGDAALDTAILEYLAGDDRPSG